MFIPVLGHPYFLSSHMVRIIRFLCKKCSFFSRGTLRAFQKVPQKTTGKDTLRACANLHPHCSIQMGYL